MLLIRRQPFKEFKLEALVLGSLSPPRHFHPGITMSDFPEDVVFGSPVKAGGKAQSSHEEYSAVSPGATQKKAETPKSKGKSPKKPATPQSKGKSPMKASSPSKGKSPMKASGPKSAKTVKKGTTKSPKKAHTPKAKSPGKSPVLKSSPGETELETFFNSFGVVNDDWIGAAKAAIQAFLKYKKRA